MQCLVRGPDQPVLPRGALTTAQGNTGRRGRLHTCGPALAGSRNNNAPAATTRPTAIWKAGLTPRLSGVRGNGTLYWRGCGQRGRSGYGLQVTSSNDGRNDYCGGRGGRPCCGGAGRRSTARQGEVRVSFVHKRLNSVKFSRWNERPSLTCIEGRRNSAKFCKIECIKNFLVTHLLSCISGHT